MNTWHPEAESEGRLARLDGHLKSENPYEDGTWLRRSWNAGWDEVDRDSKAPKAEIY